MNQYITSDGKILNGERALCTYLVQEHHEASPESDASRLEELCQRFGITLSVAPPPAPPSEYNLRQDAVNTIKQIRGETHDKFAKQSAGVPVVYALNYEAAVRFQAGDVTPLRTGMTAEQHLACFGAEMYPPKTAADFAAYIIAENLRLGPSDVEVEQLYIRAMYAAWINPMDQLEGIVADYQAFCALVQGD